LAGAGAAWEATIAAAGAAWTFTAAPQLAPVAAPETAPAAAVAAVDAAAVTVNTQVVVANNAMGISSISIKRFIHKKRAMMLAFEVDAVALAALAPR